MKKALIVLFISGLFFFLGRRSTLLFPSLSPFQMFEEEEVIVDTVVVKEKYKYTSNPLYSPAIIFHEHDPNNYKVVMFGDSHVAGVDWEVILDKKGIADRGIGRDVSEGLLNRLHTVTQLHPEKCVIEIGINDIFHDIEKEEYLDNIAAILDTFKKEKIEPIVLSIFPVGSGIRHADSALNDKIASYNKGLDSLLENKNVKFINFTPYITDTTYTKQEYLKSDYLHLNYHGVTVVAEHIKEAL